jgi:3-oxoacyl-(acyl-carrier-protein) synthase
MINTDAMGAAQTLGPLNEISVSGIGAVSPAGWGMEALRSVMKSGQEAPVSDLERPGWPAPLRVRRVPAPETRPSFSSHPRLRRSSPISQFAVAAALEALGAAPEDARYDAGRLGIVTCVMTGCVNYSRRFYDEVLRDPATASPLIFPETVFNAPASHLGALLDTETISYTLVGDPGTFLQGLALAGSWLFHKEVDECVVVAAEEADWLTSDAFRYFNRDVILAEGAAAVALRRGAIAKREVMLKAVTGSHTYANGVRPTEAAARMKAELLSSGEADLLCDGATGVPHLDAPELEAWKDWPHARVSPKRLLGEGLAAGAAWQSVLAIDSLFHTEHESAYVSVTGCNQQAIGARFELWSHE